VPRTVIYKISFELFTTSFSKLLVVKICKNDLKIFY